jgi:hypothetical protein
MITCCPKCGHIFKSEEPCPCPNKRCSWTGFFAKELKIEDLNGEHSREVFHAKIDYEGH